MPCCLLLIGFNFVRLITKLEYSQVALPDCLNRANLNLPYWDYLYVMWTNFDYIYIYFIPFIWLFIISYAGINYFSFKPGAVMCIIVFILFSQSIASPTSTSLGAFKLLDLSNTLLVNSVNKYHPLILHICLNLVLFTFLDSPGTKLNLRSQNLSLHSFTKTTIVTFLIVTTMFMGSWWAYQEGSWGGWWAWDPSEVFGLVLMLCWIYAFHLNFMRSLFSRNARVFKLILYVNLLVYTTLQSNFSITSHNFGLRDESSLMTKLAFYLVLLVTLSALVSSSKALAGLSKRVPAFLGVAPLKHWGLFLAALVALTAVLGLLPLITDLLWKVFSVNAANFSANYAILLLLLAALTVLNTHTPSWVLLYYTLFPIIAWAGSFTNFQVLICYLAIPRLSLFTKTHKLILLSIILSPLSIEYCTSSNLLEQSLLLTNSLPTAKSFFNLFLATQHSSETIFSSAGAYSNPSLGFSPAFNLLATHSNYYQLFISNSSRLLYYNFSIDPLLCSISASYLLFSALYLFFFKKNQVIKC